MTEFQTGDKVRIKVARTHDNLIVDSDGVVYLLGYGYFDVNTETEGYTVELIERPWKKAREYAVGDVVRTAPYVPFIKLQRDQWTPIGGSGGVFSDQDMDVIGYIGKSTKLILNINSQGTVTE